MRQMIYQAMRQCDDLVVEFDYTDANGVATHRVVSPIRFLGGDRFLALCLSREEGTRRRGLQRLAHRRDRPGLARAVHSPRPHYRGRATDAGCELSSWGSHLTMIWHLATAVSGVAPTRCARI